MAFDIIGAKRAGYSDPEIADFLGGKYGINISGARDAGYSDQEIIGKALSKYGAGTDDKPQPEKPSVRKRVADLVRPSLEMVGTVAGEALGAPFSPVTGGASIPALGGLGYASGAGIANLIEGKPASLASIGEDISTGAKYVMAGNAALPALSMAAKGTGAVVKPLLGKLSGVGPGAIDEAIKSGTMAVSGNPLASKTAFDKALRGKIGGEEIVDNARSALNTLKEARASKYQTDLAKVSQSTGPVNDAPVFQNLSDLMQKYRIRLTATSKGQVVDTSQAAMGKAGRNDIADVVDEIIKWKDKSPIGMDALKRRLDDFYSDSSQARQFVASVRDSVRKSIVDSVPAYDDMTKSYSEATSLIKDVEADLMLRKQGMSGRITADKTLRRLTSAMRDNFEMRRELVDILGAKGGEDLAGQIAGYSMQGFMPKGMAAFTNAPMAAAATYINPKFWPILAASSPRVQGEFLRVFGKGLATAQKVPPQAVKGAVIQSAIATEPITKGDQP